LASTVGVTNVGVDSVVGKLPGVGAVVGAAAGVGAGAVAAAGAEFPPPKILLSENDITRVFLKLRFVGVVFRVGCILILSEYILVSL
jgi:hypothetical protein